MITVRPVDRNYAHQTWPMVEGYIRSALETEYDGVPMYSIEHVQNYLSIGEWLLCVAVDESNRIKGACTIQFYNQPLHRVAFISTCGGRLVSNKDTVNQVKDIARQNGATLITAVGRPAIARLWRRYGFNQTNILLEQLL